MARKTEAEKAAEAREQRTYRRTEFARELGSSKSGVKIKQVMLNLAARESDEIGGKPPKPLFDIECARKSGKEGGGACPGGESLDPSTHHWSCPRGQAITRRIKQKRDVLTGDDLRDTAERERVAESARDRLLEKAVQTLATLEDEDERIFTTKEALRAELEQIMTAGASA
jgi:hypothetical protein